MDRLVSYTNKPVSLPKNAEDRIWLVAGEGSPTQYFLRATFLIAKVEESDKPGFEYLVTGKDGQLFEPMPLISKEAWFPEFRKKQGNFAFGFNIIKQSDVQDGLRKIHKAHTLSSIS